MTSGKVLEDAGAWGMIDQWDVWSTLSLQMFFSVNKPSVFAN